MTKQTTKRTNLKYAMGYSSPADFQDFVAHDPCELWAEYSPIGWANTSERAEQMPDDYNDYFVVG